MYKEIIIIILVLTIVVSLDVLTNHYTKQSVSAMNAELEELREEILNQNQKKAKHKIEEILDKWQKRNNIMAYYIEHDELEKVHVQLTGLAANINQKEYPEGMVQLDTTLFLLQHMEEKQKLDTRSIF